MFDRRLGTEDRRTNPLVADTAMAETGPALDDVDDARCLLPMTSRSFWTAAIFSFSFFMSKILFLSSGSWEIHAIKPGFMTVIKN